MTFDFQTQLKVGAKGEAWLCEAFPMEFQVQASNPQRWFDIYTYRGNTLITCEVKTDTRTAKTGNIFWEMMTCTDGKPCKPGGPWRSLYDRVDVFAVVVWGQDGPVEARQWDNVGRLVVKLDMYVAENKVKPRLVRNAGYHGMGYALPMGAVAPDKVFLAPPKKTV